MHHAILASRPENVVPSKHTRIRMICNAAGGLLPNLAIDLRDTFGGAVVLPSYGMTEWVVSTLPVCCSWHDLTPGRCHMLDVCPLLHHQQTMHLTALAALEWPAGLIFRSAILSTESGSFPVDRLAPSPFAECRPLKVTRPRRTLACLWTRPRSLQRGGLIPATWDTWMPTGACCCAIYILTWLLTGLH